MTAVWFAYQMALKENERLRAELADKSALLRSTQEALMMIVDDWDRSPVDSERLHGSWINSCCVPIAKAREAVTP